MIIFFIIVTIVIGMLSVWFNYKAALGFYQLNVKRSMLLHVALVLFSIYILVRVIYSSIFVWELI